MDLNLDGIACVVIAAIVAAITLTKAGARHDEDKS